MPRRIDAQDLAGPRRARTTATFRPRRERDIQRAILDFVRTVPGVTAWKTGGGLLPLADGRRVRMGRRGVSDIVGWQTLRDGGRRVWRGGVGKGCHYEPVAVFLAVEVKQPGKQPTDEQRAFLDAVKTAGGIAVVATCVDDVASALGLTPTRRAGR